MKYDELIYGSTTIIEVKGDNICYSGTGFFYSALEDRDPNKGPQWIRIKGIYLVTNRHVALPSDNIEKIPDDFTFTFNLRKQKGTSIEWYPIVMNKEEYFKRLKSSP